MRFSSCLVRKLPESRVLGERGAASVAFARDRWFSPNAQTRCDTQETPLESDLLQSNISIRPAWNWAII
jgi:hypothetical protein